MACIMAHTLRIEYSASLQPVPLLDQAPEREERGESVRKYLQGAVTYIIYNFQQGIVKRKKESIEFAVDYIFRREIST